MPDNAFTPGHPCRPWPREAAVIRLTGAIRTARGQQKRLRRRPGAVVVLTAVRIRLSPPGSLPVSRGLAQHLAGPERNLPKGNSIVSPVSWANPEQIYRAPSQRLGLVAGSVLPPFHINVGQYLVKSPKVHVRDSGIGYALLRLDDRDALLGHPVAGGNWKYSRWRTSSMRPRSV